MRYCLWMTTSMWERESKVKREREIERMCFEIRKMCCYDTSGFHKRVQKHNVWPLLSLFFSLCRRATVCVKRKEWTLRNVKCRTQSGSLIVSPPPNVTYILPLNKFDIHSIHLNYWSEDFEYTHFPGTRAFQLKKLKIQSPLPTSMLVDILFVAVHPEWTIIA